MKKSKMEVMVESNNAFLYRKNDELPTGHLWFTGFHSGAIWMEKDVIGEYYMNSQGKFEITEIENGFKIPGSGTSRTPLEFLIKKVEVKFKKKKGPLRLLSILHHARD